MHTIPTKDYWVYVFGGPGRRFQQWFDRTAKKRGIPDRDFRIRFLYQPFLDHIKGRAATSKEVRSEEHTSELQSPCNLVCRLLLEKKKNTSTTPIHDHTYLSSKTPLSISYDCPQYPKRH